MDPGSISGSRKAALHRAETGGRVCPGPLIRQTVDPAKTLGMFDGGCPDDEGRHFWDEGLGSCATPLAMVTEKSVSSSRSPTD